MSERRTGVPLYYRVMRSLRETITSGEVAPGDRLPTEAELMERYGVSRVVVRQALGILSEEGLIFRVRGKGTFVSEEAAQAAAPSLSGYLEDLIRRGLPVAVEVLDFGLRPMPSDVAAALGAEDDARALFVKRLRTVEGEPFAVVDAYVPETVGARLRLEDLRREPLMRLLETAAGVEIGSASEVFQAVAADEVTARLLAVDPLAPVLKMTLTAYSVQGSPVNLEHVYFRSDRYHYRAHFHRRRGGDRGPEWIPVDRLG